MLKKKKTRRKEILFDIFVLGFIKYMEQKKISAIKKKVKKNMKITFVNSDFVKSEGLWVAGFFPPTFLSFLHLCMG